MSQQQEQFLPEQAPQGLAATFLQSQIFTATLLGENDIPAFLALQKKVWNTLPLDERHFLKVRTQEDLQNHLAARMPIIGILDVHKNLVAQCLLAYPVNVEAVINLSGYPIQGREATTAIVQSVGVEPDFCKKGITQLLLDVAKERAIMTGHTNIIAKIADANEKSKKSFLKNGFRQASEGIDPVQKYAVTFWQISLHGCNAASPGVAL